jgi:hypothetical protein
MGEEWPAAERQLGVSAAVEVVLVLGCLLPSGRSAASVGASAPGLHVGWAGPLPPDAGYCLHVQYGASWCIQVLLGQAAAAQRPTGPVHVNGLACAGY